MARMECDALPNGSTSMTPKRPLSRSLRKSASNRGEQRASRLNPNSSTPPRPLPPPPLARSKPHSHGVSESNPRATALSPSPQNPATATEENGCDGPGIFVKSFFRSSTFSALRARSFRSGREDAVEVPESSPYSLQSGPSDKQHVPSLGVLTKGLLDLSRNAVKAVQDKSRHLVNKRFQDGVFHLDMVYITENIIAMGFPDNDSGPDILGFKEGNYRDNIEELVTFCELQHPGKYKIFNLCSEKLYDTSLLHDKVACFPFEGNSCPPLLLITAFCEAAYGWLKAGLENVVVVHCKRGLARTGLMISCLLLHLKFFPTAEESMKFYNQKRCVDSKGLHIPSQLRYVKYYEQVLKEQKGSTPTGRRCTMRSVRLVNCPSWIRPAVTISDHDGVVFSSQKHLKTKSTLAEDMWLRTVKSGVLLYELPDNGHVAAVDGDFKIHFQDRNVEFSCWLNTNMVGGGHVILFVYDLDDYEKGLLQEATGFQVDLELQDTYIPVAMKILDSAPPKTQPCLLPQLTTLDPTIDEEPTIFTDSEGEEESRGQAGEQQLKRELSNPTAFQSAVSQAVTEISLGFLHAMEKVGMRNQMLPKSGSSAPTTPRMMSAEQELADSVKALKLQASKELLRKQFTYDFEAGEATRTTTMDGESSAPSLDRGGASTRNEDDVKMSFCDSTSEFQAFVAASAADASLFTFGDDEDDFFDEG